MARPILITGAAGHIGGQIARFLAEQGQPLRLMGRDFSRLPQLPNSETVQADYADPASLDVAFAGVDAAFIVSGYAREGVRAHLHKNAIDAAARAGVNHLVYLSFQQASPASKFPMGRDHAMTEGFLQESGVPFTALRDNLYLEELVGMVNEDGVIRGPAGQGAVAWIPREDAARTVAAVLANPEGKHGAFDVTGPESLTFAESAARLGALVGRDIRYEEETVEAGRAWRSKYNAPDWEVDTWLGSYEAVAAGELAATSDTVERFTGRAPYTLEAYFAAHPELLDQLRPHPL